MLVDYLIECGEFDVDSRTGSLNVFMNLDLRIVDHNLSRFLQALGLKAGFSDRWRFARMSNQDACATRRSPG